jgi:hypothetical protein
VVLIFGGTPESALSAARASKHRTHRMPASAPPSRRSGRPASAWVAARSRHASFSGREANQGGVRQSERVGTKRVHLEIVKKSGPHEQYEPAHILAVRVDHYRIQRRLLSAPGEY